MSDDQLIEFAKFINILTFTHLKNFVGFEFVSKKYFTHFILFFNLLSYLGITILFCFYIKENKITDCTSVTKCMLVTQQLLNRFS